MNICRRIECHTTAGCKNRGPNGEFCWFYETSYADASWFDKFGRLGDFSDEEIAAEYHRRCLKSLGDQRVGVSTFATGIG